MKRRCVDPYDPSVGFEGRAPVAVRGETPSDYDAIDHVVAEAFGRAEVAQMVRLIRASSNFVADLAVVAEVGGQVVGHTMLSYVDVVDGGTTWPVLALSPVSVAKQAQRRGIGLALVNEVVRRADMRREPLVLVEGIPAYYPRFGFRLSTDLGIEYDLPSWAPKEAGMALALTGYDSAMRGRVVYPPAFAIAQE